MLNQTLLFEIKAIQKNYWDSVVQMSSMLTV